MAGHTGVAQQAREAVDRTQALDARRRRYQEAYGGVEYTKHRLVCRLFELPPVTTRTVSNRFGVERSTAYRAIEALEDEGVLAAVP